MLDSAPPGVFDPLFFKAIAAEGVLDPFRRPGGRTLIALDGTECFASRKIHCPRCSTRKRSDGGTGYFHAFLGASIVAPGHQQVLPLPPEFVAPQDGAEKQDCERNAVICGKRTTTIYRWLSGAADTGHGRRIDGQLVLDRNPKR